MMQKFEARAGESLKIPKDIMSKFKHKIVVGETTGVPLVIFCQSFAWDKRANRWRFSYALVANYDQIAGQPPVKRATLYKSLAVVNSPMLILSLTPEEKSEASDA